MIIMRDGKEIELTPQELLDAYYEQEHKWDMNYISQDLPVLFNDEGDYDEEIKRLQTDKGFCSRMAHKYREYLEDRISVDDDEWPCWKDAYAYASRE